MYMDGRTDELMDGRTGWFLYTPQTLFAGGITIKIVERDKIDTPNTQIDEHSLSQ